MKKPVEQKSRRIRQSPRRGAAEQGIQSKTRLREVRPHLDFLNRPQGSLPEAITEGNLTTLNLGLGFLFAWLREARQQHDRDEDGGRAAAFTALGAMSQFLALFNSSVVEQLHVPILKLMDALAALDQNNVLPILRRVARVGRAPSSTAYSSLQGLAAGAAMRLQMLEVDPQQACALVAKELTKLGVKPDRGRGGITGNTVRHWCDHVAGRRLEANATAITGRSQRRSDNLATQRNRNKPGTHRSSRSTAGSSGRSTEIMWVDGPG